MELEKIISDISPMSDEGMEQLRRLLTPRKVPARTLLVRPGEVSRELFIVLKGIARNYSLYDGKETTRWFGQEGDVMAEMFSFVHGKPAACAIESVTEMELLVADKDNIHRLIKTNPEWSLWTSQYLIDGLYWIERRFVYLGQGDAYTRYQNLLQYKSFEPYEANEMLNQIPLQQIASYLGITPQTLSRLRRKIARNE